MRVLVACEESQEVCKAFRAGGGETMIHLGDITKLNGAEIPVVDCITGGSPCQDLSVAGKRAGLKGERSGLFMEQVRIVREMRERDRARGRTGYMVRPRYMVWENVPGAFSSAKGEDFAAVVEEILKVCEPGASVSVRVPDRGWPKSGCYYADDGSWSIAWRVHDAQFWGVPQRRKRIALVADFGGLSAPEVLFERKGLRWHPDESEPAGKEAAGGTGEGITETSGCMTGWDCQSKRIFDPDAISGALNSGTNEGVNIVPSVFCLKGNAIDRDTAQNGQWANEDVSYSLDATDRHGVAIPANTQIATRHKAMGERTGLGVGTDGDPAFTLQAGHEHGVAVLNDQGGSMMSVTHEVTGTLRSQEHGHQPVVAGFKAGQAKAGGIGWQEECAPTLSAGASGVEPTVYDARGNGNGATSPTLTGDHQNRVTDYTALCVGNGQLNQISMAEQANTLDTMHDQQAIIAFAQNSRNEVRLQGRDGQIAGAIASNEGMKQRTYLAYGLDSNKNGYQEQAGAIQAHDSGGATEMCCDHQMTVRRLTPLECERLQGYPDGWTDIGEWTDSKGKKRQTTDTARYKVLGNSIALPFWFWLLRRISAQYERPATLGSLFDGIGGFPLCWERCNGKGTAVWASEIEEFPIAVTKRRFGDD